MYRHPQAKPAQQLSNMECVIIYYSQKNNKTATKKKDKQN